MTRFEIQVYAFLSQLDDYQSTGITTKQALLKDQGTLILKSIKNIRRQPYKGFIIRVEKFQ